MNIKVFPADAIMMKLWLFSGNGKPREILRILSICDEYELNGIDYLFIQLRLS